MGCAQNSETQNHWAKGGGGKGASKHGGKGGASGKAAGKGGGKVDRTCHRRGCHAAEKHKATFGGASNCFVSGLSLRATLPVEQLVDWAYEARLEAKKVETKTKVDASKAQPQASPQPQAKAKPQPSPKPAAPDSAELLTALRTERLAALKAATDPAPPTITQEVASVFNE